MIFINIHFSTEHYNPIHSDVNFQQQQQHNYQSNNPNHFVDFNPYRGQTEKEMYEEAKSEGPRTPVRHHQQNVPIMGMRTYQHRRTSSNVSSQYSNRGFQQEYEYEPQEINPNDMDYRFNNFNNPNSISIREQPFHSMPYHGCNRLDHNEPTIPSRMRVYENIANFQDLQNTSHLHPCSSSSQNQTPIKISPAAMYQNNSKLSYDNTPHTYLKTTAITNSARRQMFFSSDLDDVVTVGEFGEAIESVDNVVANGNNKLSNSTGCTPTHSTPQDSLSDDSSYLSALSRVRFSPENILSDNNLVFSPNRLVTSQQRTRKQPEDAAKS